jgi:hypothetical protein
MLLLQLLLYLLLQLLMLLLSLLPLMLLQVQLLLRQLKGISSAFQQASRMCMRYLFSGRFLPCFL